jgi:hypothetical protein
LANSSQSAIKAGTSAGGASSMKVCFGQLRRIEQAIKQVDGTGVADHFLMMRQRPTFNGESISQHKRGFAQGEGVAFQCGGCVRPQIA